MTIPTLAGKRPAFIVTVLLAALIVVAYSNSFTIGFHFDDIGGIAENPSVTSLRNIPSFFTDPFTLTKIRENVDLRPVLQTTFALNYAISGLSPWSWHAVNLVLHFLAALLVFLIVRDHLWPGGVEHPHVSADVAAAAAALFFALAPLNTQPLDYMWARSALLCTTLYLGAFYCFLAGLKTGLYVRYWVAMCVLHALALLTKAIALTLPGAIVLYVVLYDVRTRGSIRAVFADWRRYAVPLGALAALNLAYLAFRSVILPSWALIAGKEQFVTPLIWLKSQWSAQLYMVRLFVWPDALSIDHAFPYTYSITEPRAWISLGLIAGWIAVAIALVRRHPIVTFATLWFFLTLSVESTVFPLSEVVNDHRPYIASSLGLSVLLAWLLDRATRLFAFDPRATFVTATAVLCLAAIPVTLHRNWQWNDYVRIWEDAARKGPTNGRAWMNAGAGLMARADAAGARRDFELARQATPSYPYVYMNLAVLDMYEGRSADALKDAQEAVRLNPNLSLTHFYLGQALEKNGRRDEAADSYSRAVQADPRNTQAQQALQVLQLEASMRDGVAALYTRHDPSQAIARFQSVLTVNPTHYGATYQLAKALDAAGRRNEATPVWLKMLGMAEAIHDAPTIATCRARLAAAQ